jgi:hypothetical protein
MMSVRETVIVPAAPGEFRMLQSIIATNILARGAREKIYGAKADKDLIPITFYVS